MTGDSSNFTNNLSIKPVKCAAAAAGHKKQHHKNETKTHDTNTEMA